MDHKCPFGTFYGEVRRASRVAGFALTETVYGPRESLPRHAHDGAFVCLVLRGGYTECYGIHSREYEARALVFHPDGEVHSDRFHASGGRVFSVAVPHRQAARLREVTAMFEDRVTLDAGPPVRLAARLYGEFRQPDALTPLVVEGLILEILGHAARRHHAPVENVPPPWLRKALELLRARFRENLPLGEVARAAGVHPSHLARSFRRHHGCSAGEYVRHLRVDHACRRLCRGTEPLAEIALDAGFADQSHFSLVFKRHTGLTPSAYRRVFRAR